MDGHTRLGRALRALVLVACVLAVGYLAGRGASSIASKVGMLLGEPPLAQMSGSAAASLSGDEAYTTWDVTANPNYYRVAGSAVVGEVPAPGTVVYGSLDRLGRATGVVANVSYESMQTGRTRERQDASDIHPSGWGSNAEVDIALPDGSIYHGLLFNRSHLLAKSLGGAEDVRNLITGTRTQNVGANLGGSEGGMAYGEGLARAWLDAHPQGTLYYAATPIYHANELLARSVLVDLRSSDGSLDQRIEVYNAALGFELDYASGSFAVTASAADLVRQMGAAHGSEPSSGISASGVTLTGSSQGERGERMVIVTGSGRAYHHDETCRGLAQARSMRWVSVEEAQQMGRHPCGICGG